MFAAAINGSAVKSSGPISGVFVSKMELQFFLLFCPVGLAKRHLNARRHRLGLMEMTWKLPIGVKSHAAAGKYKQTFVQSFLFFAFVFVVVVLVLLLLL